MKRKAGSPLSRELDALVKSVAEQCARYLNEPRHRFLDFAEHPIRRALSIFEDRLVKLAAKSEFKEPLSSYTEVGLEDHRTHNLKSFNGCGFGCDICSGGYDTPTFMSLRIGSYKAQVHLDLCKPCSKRLSAIVDARLEDRRRHQ